MPDRKREEGLRFCKKWMPADIQKIISDTQKDVKKELGVKMGQQQIVYKLIRQSQQKA